MKPPRGLRLLRKYLERVDNMAEWARLVGVPKFWLSHVKAGRRMPTLERAFLLERATQGKVPARSWIQP